MRSLAVVKLAPLFDHHARFAQTRKPFLAQTFVAQFAVETFALTNLPRSPRLDVNDSDCFCRQLFSHGRGDKLRTVVRKNEFRQAVALFENSFLNLFNRCAGQRTPDCDRRRLAFARRVQLRAGNRRFARRCKSFSSARISFFLIVEIPAFKVGVVLRSQFSGLIFLKAS